MFVERRRDFPGIVLDAGGQERLVVPGLLSVHGHALHDPVLDERFLGCAELGFAGRHLVGGNALPETTGSRVTSLDRRTVLASLEHERHRPHVEAALLAQAAVTAETMLGQE